MKDLRTRRGSAPDVDLDGPGTWTRGGAWEDEQQLHRAALDVDRPDRTARPR
jgi:hypothetical protein